MTFEFKEKFKAAISATLEHRRLTAFYPIHTCDQGHRCVHITKLNYCSGTLSFCLEPGV